MKKTFWLLACFGIIYVCSCKKEPLPFQNSFSCKIDGVDWKPEGGTNATGGINSQDIIVYRSYYGDAITVNTLKNVRESKSGNSIVFEGFQLGIDLQLNKVKKPPSVSNHRTCFFIRYFF